MFGSFGQTTGPITTLATFSVSPSSVDVGDTFSLNIFNVLAGLPPIEQDFVFFLTAPFPVIPENTAWTFNNFRVTDTDRTTGAAVGVPEPATWALLILGFGFAGGALRRSVAIAA